MLMLKQIKDLIRIVIIYSYRTTQ